MQDYHISSTQFSNISAIKKTKSQNSNYTQEFKFMDSFLNSSNSKNKKIQSKNSKNNNQIKHSLTKNSSSNLQNNSEIGIEKLNEEKSYKGKESNVTEKSDIIVFKQISEDTKNKGGNSDFSTILKNIMNGNIKYFIFPFIIFFKIVEKSLLPPLFLVSSLICLKTIISDFSVTFDSFPLYDFSSFNFSIPISLLFCRLDEEFLVKECLI